MGAVQWTVAAAAAATDLVYTNELRYEMASPLLSRWFVRCRRNESSPLFIFFSTWNYDYAPYQLKQMLTRAREDPWWKLCIASCSKKRCCWSCVTRTCRWTVRTLYNLNLQILYSAALKASLYIVCHKFCTWSPQQWRICTAVPKIEECHLSACPRLLICNICICATFL